MTTWIEPPPKRKGMGCIGKGCLLIIIFLILLVVAFVIGFYTGTKPKEIPQVQTSVEEQKVVQTRWDEFAGNQIEIAPPVPTPTPPPVEEGAPPPEVAPPPVETPASPNRIELTAGDINQLISASRRTRGKAFVSIDNNVAHLQITYPLDKVPGFSGRFLNAELEVRAAADGSPNGLQIRQVSLMGIPEGMVKSLMGSHSPQSYISEFAGKYGITSLTIENNKVILEKSGGR